MDYPVRQAQDELEKSRNQGIDACFEIAFRSTIDYFTMNLPKSWATFLFLLVSLCFLVLPALADVDPGMVGTWETNGVNELGPWKLTWEIRQDSSYILSGALSDSGIIGSGDGRWHTVSNVTKQSADGIYILRDANHFEGTGPLGSGVWTRVRDANTGTTPAASSEWNPFANVFPEKGTASSRGKPLNGKEAEYVSRELANDYANASIQKDKDSRDRLEKKARSGISEAQVLFGMLLQKEKNFTEAVSWYRKAAQQGNVDGMRALGSCYRHGEGVSEDATEAMKWFRKASDQGDSDADSDIGGLYHNGHGVPKDDAAAVAWFRKGASKGSSYAMSDLAACYWTGTGVEKSAREAISWWKQAAEKGDKDAKENLEMALEQFDESGQPRTRK
jgi:TPR repeat protein